MNWSKITDISELESIKIESQTKPVVIFKHSTRCSISATALDRFERNADKTNDSEKAGFYYLDLIAHRDISNKIASDFKIAHESPQMILIKNGEAVFSASHYDIDYQELMGKINTPILH